MAAVHIYGLRVVAGVSLLSAIMLIITSAFVFIARLEDLKSSKFPASQVPANFSSPLSDPAMNDDYTQLLDMMSKLWTKNRPVLVSSSMLAILAGLLQSIFSGLVLLADSKAISMYIRKWVTVHFILIFVLFIILMNTIVLTEHTKEKKTWSDMTDMLKKYLEHERPNTDYSELYRFLSVGVLFIYISGGVDIAIILLLMGTTMYLMKNHTEDYEACE